MYTKHIRLQPLLSPTWGTVGVADMWLVRTLHYTRVQVPQECSIV